MKWGWTIHDIKIISKNNHKISGDFKFQEMKFSDSKKKQCNWFRIDP